MTITWPLYDSWCCALPSEILCLRGGALSGASPTPDRQALISSTLPKRQGPRRLRPRCEYFLTSTTSKLSPPSLYIKLQVVASKMHGWVRLYILCLDGLVFQPASGLCRPHGHLYMPDVERNQGSSTLSVTSNIPLPNGAQNPLAVFIGGFKGQLNCLIRCCWVSPFHLPLGFKDSVTS